MTRLSFRPKLRVFLLIGITFSIVIVMVRRNEARVATPDEIMKDQVCLPKKKVYYLKTHKTGSSSIFNIIARHAVKNGLRVAIPEKRRTYNFWPRVISPRLLHKDSYPPDVLMVHSRFNEREAGAMFPRKDSLYVTILRNCTTQWPSIVGYFHLKRAALDFYNHPLEAIVGGRVNASKPVKPIENLVRNPNLYDLGFDYPSLSSDAKVDEAIRTIDRAFDLVLIMELWEESLLLLKEHLCMDLDEVVVLNVNENLPHKKPKKLTMEMSERVMAWNEADDRLYRHFYNKLKENTKHISQIPKEALKERRERWERICVAGRAKDTAYANVRYLGYVLRSNIKGEQRQYCSNLIRKETDYIDYFRLMMNKGKRALT